ncbi:hypothetical protein PbJCM13498_17900 [Prolixibacter bellariivorans]|uniref:Glycosyl hydrolase family 88 n=1 Tax=Prolixibacter bellariivorans TaxID=314319 RepID=A0A5M4AZT7_9BACT|nr:glycoside hydrolase family 88 protein [Prolixibacter bellariivorans]GET32927.1 hypothetical protein PbJCM13498_17900 [Prolixibacter bellariivorans]
MKTIDCIENRNSWVTRLSIVFVLLLTAHVNNAQTTSQLSGKLTRPAVYQAMEKVADWQLNTPLQHNLTDWTNGALYKGMVEWAKIADSSKYYNWLYQVGEKTNWQLGQRKYLADDHAVGMMYLEMYRKYHEKKMLEPTLKSLDWIMKHPSHASIKNFSYKKGNNCTDRWSWCDALFMGPTVWATMANVNGKKKYLKFMTKEYKATADYLFDTNEDLFYRDDRYFDMREANDKKIFWGRGNGWVFAGLAIIMTELPENYKERPYFEDIFKKMATKLATLQDSSGYWHASLLDPQSYPAPETSATAFYVYGMAWGIANGLLNKETYLPVVQKGWNALIQAVHLDGKLGWVQPIGADPKHVTSDMTEVYGVGGFLLAGSEIYKMLQ